MSHPDDQAHVASAAAGPSPSLAAPAPAPVIDVALAALCRRRPDGAFEVLVARRHADAVRGGLWEFPGGKIERGEEPAQAARREVEEEVGVGAMGFDSPLEPLLVVEHVDPEATRERSVRLHAFVVEVKPDVRPEAIGSSEVRWVGIDELDRYPSPLGNRPIHEALGRRLGTRGSVRVPPLDSPFTAPSRSRTKIEEPPPDDRNT